MKQNKNGARRDVERYLRAGVRVIWIQSPEETRIESILKWMAAERLGRSYVTWSVTRGFRSTDRQYQQEALKDPRAGEGGHNVPKA